MKKKIAKALGVVLMLCVCMLMGSLKADAAVKLSACKITVKAAVLKAGTATPVVTVTYKNKALKKGKDYQISLKNNKNYGTATCVIKGIKKYSGTVTKKFQVIPGAIKNLKFVLEKYEDGSEEAMLRWNSISGVTGYVLYLSDSKNGTYHVTKYIAAEEWNEMRTGADYLGCYAKLRSFVYKNGSYYYGAYSKPVKITKASNNEMVKMQDYEITAPQLKAPTNVKLVYDSHPSINDELPKSLCIQYTNASEVTVKDWYIEIFNSNGNCLGSINLGMELKAGETGNADISGYFMYNVYPGCNISKIRIIPMDGGTDGWTSGPWYNSFGGSQASDDTFGSATVFECNIKINLEEKETLTGTYEPTEWGSEAIKFKPKKNVYESMEFSLITRNGGSGGGTGRIGEDGYYRYSFNEASFKDDMKDPISFATVSGIDYATLKLVDDKTVSVIVDRYILTDK